MGIEAFDRFEKGDPGVPSLWYEDGDYFAAVACVAGSWGYAVYDRGQAVCGHRSYHQGAADACESALRAIETRKHADVTAAPEPPPVDTAAWTPDPDRETEADTR